MKQANNERDLQPKEIIFTLMGVIASKELPPLRKKPNMPPAKYKLLHQSVTLAGLGMPTFETAIVAAKSIHGAFDHQFAEKTLMAWTESNTDQPMLHGINITNRYFTPKVEAQAMEHIDFLPGMDPHGILCHMVKGDGVFSYIHTKDNQVQFF
ncbi:hypothetical protein L208DRAFT_1276137 [Tricholoma matsutake]|nr:hypothetical protein L208DRAFT_1276137 [Tricholoma matsutake 945]